MATASIIIPTHNRAAWLPRAVKSAFEAGSDVEVIVVDDRSTDETPEVCKNLQGIRYLRLERNLKLAGARNIGIANSSGEYLAFLDDDDQRLPGSLDIQLKVLESNPNAGFAYGQVLFGDPQNCIPTGEIHPEQCITGDIFWELLDENFIHIPSVVVRKQCLLDVGLFDPSIEGVEDWDAWIRLAERYTVMAVEEPVAIYRTFNRTSGQLSSNRVAMCRASAQAQAKGLRLPRALTAPPEVRKRVRQRYLNSLSDMLTDETITALAGRNPRKAFASHIAALRLSPLRVARLGTLRLLLKICSRINREANGLIKS